MVTAQERKDRVNSLTMLFSDLWNEKYRSKLFKVFEVNSKGLEVDSQPYIMFGGRKAKYKIDKKLFLEQTSAGGQNYSSLKTR